MHTLLDDGNDDDVMSSGSQFHQDILAYLALFVEPASGAGTGSELSHPANLVLDAFKSPEVAKSTNEKLRIFLEEAMKMHEKKMELASVPVPWRIH